jgi:hypothetical protein
LLLLRVTASSKEIAMQFLESALDSLGQDRIHETLWIASGSGSLPFRIRIAAGICVAALRQDFANTPPALASNTQSSGFSLPGVVESIHTSHRLRGDVDTLAKHSQRPYWFCFRVMRNIVLELDVLQAQQSVSAVNDA